jgi:hypothetical protein
MGAVAGRARRRADSLSRSREQVTAVERSDAGGAWSTGRGMRGNEGVGEVADAVRQDNE